MDWMKLNVDAAVDGKRGVVGYSAAVRNHEGLVTAAGIAQGVFFDDVEVAEAAVSRSSDWFMSTNS